MLYVSMDKETGPLLATGSADPFVYIYTLGNNVTFNNSFSNPMFNVKTNNMNMIGTI